MSSHRVVCVQILYTWPSCSRRELSESLSLGHWPVRVGFQNKFRFLSLKVWDSNWEMLENVFAGLFEMALRDGPFEMRPEIHWKNILTSSANSFPIAGRCLRLYDASFWGSFWRLLRAATSSLPSGVYWTKCPVGWRVKDLALMT